MSHPSPARVLVTRSEPGASETAARLRAAGFEPIVEPLFAITPVEAELPDFDAIAFTSANGVRQFAKLNERRGPPVFCVGGRTAAEAAAAGFETVISADGDVNALAQLIIRRLARGARLLHVGNEESRGDLAGQLVAAKLQAAFVALFRAAPVSEPGPTLAAVLAGRDRIDAVLIHSPRAGAILAGFAGKAGIHLPVVAISQAAAAPLAGIASPVAIAATPDEAAMFSALSHFVFG